MRRELAQYEHPLFDFEARAATEGVEVMIRYKPADGERFTITRFCCGRAKSSIRNFPGHFRSTFTTACTTTSSRCSRAIRSGRIDARASAEHCRSRRFLQRRSAPPARLPLPNIWTHVFTIPQFGYYMKPNQAPRRDYFTSVDVSPVFGRLLARQFQEMWELLDRPNPFPLIEAGAGTGALAKQILDFAAESLGEFYAAIQYVAVERSAGSTSDAGKPECPAGWARAFFIRSEAACRDTPRHAYSRTSFLMRFRSIASSARREAFEKFTSHWARTVFAKRGGPLSMPAIGEYFKEQGIELRESQQAEAGLAARDWVVEAGRRLGRGFLVTIDYGHEARELYDERHMRGTLLAYDRHRASEEFFRAPGEQDLTAHVNFTALDLSGQAAPGSSGQGSFRKLISCLSLARQERDALILQRPGETEDKKTRGRLLFKTLIHPEGMGETFQFSSSTKELNRRDSRGSILSEVSAGFRINRSKAVFSGPVCLHPRRAWWTPDLKQACPEQEHSKRQRRCQACRPFAGIFELRRVLRRCRRRCHARG